ncbi:MAG TPA: SH3 domain-containing protein [Aggregatilineales bacterium]|nr:SH3 domain-containing protein [Aggregatilineales bacterium]
MNRRIVVPAFITGLALCLAIVALPVEGAQSGVAQQATPTNGAVDPCNPKPPVPGTVTASVPLAVNTKAVDGAPAVAYMLFGDQVNVIGKTSNGFWALVQTNAGPIGWAQSPYIVVDPKQWAKVPVVDGTVDVVQPVATAAPTGEATAAATQPAVKCPVITGTVSGTIVALKTKPDTKSDDLGVNVRQDEIVTVLAFNGPATWFKVKTKNGDIGWLFNAYLIVPQAQRSSIPHDYSTAEIVPTPTS